MKTIIVHSPNWLGDVVMALPAWRKWRDAHGDDKVYVLAKASVAGIWKFMKDVDGIVVLKPGKEGMREAVEEIRALGCDEAIVLPQSFRSAHLCWRGKVKRCRGTVGQFRFFFIADRVSLAGLDKAHQQYEYARLMGVEEENLPSPSAALNVDALPPYSDIAGVDDALIVLPGAARGPSKRWPGRYFAEVGAEAVRAGLAKSVLVCGTPGESEDCRAVEEALAQAGIAAVNLCGRTKLGELAWLLSKCRAVISNDSGGMHLATAMGAPVVAIFGITDPEKTGPLGASRVVAAEGVRHARAVPRESEEATRALNSVSPVKVFEALKELLING